jgi:hypothetical protein
MAGESNRNPMALVRAIRCLRASLLAIFVIAQVVGVIPLLYDHTLNLYETTPAAAHNHPHVQPTLANPDADHHHGALGLHDQCCTSHTLAAPLPQVTGVGQVHFGSEPFFLVELTALFGRNPAILDRPPKPLPLT